MPMFGVRLIVSAGMGMTSFLSDSPVGIECSDRRGLD
jgi:hypothetical protein